MSTRIVVGMNPRPFAVAIAAGLCVASLCAAAVHAQNKVAERRLHASAIQVDGKPEEAWSKATPSGIAICMNPQRTAQLNDCKVSGTVQALWNGPLLYLLFTVADPDIATASPQDTSAPACKSTSTSSTTNSQSSKKTTAPLPSAPLASRPAIEPTPDCPTTRPSGPPTSNPPPQRPAWTPLAARLDIRRGRLVHRQCSLKNGTKIGMEFVINTAPVPPHRPVSALLEQWEYQRHQ